MKNDKGFTLIELMVVVVILGILAIIMVPKIPNMMKKANEGVTKGSLSALRGALSIYYSDVEGYYPIASVSNEGDNITSAINTALVPKYIKSIPIVKIPTAHTGTSGNTVYGYTTLPTVGGAAVVNDGTAWGYCGVKISTDYGSIIVNCSHTDTNSSTWIAY